MLRRIHDPDRGASLLEYTAVIVLAAALAAGLLVAIPRTEITGGVSAAVESIFGGEGSDGGAGDPGTGTQGAPAEGAGEPEPGGGSGEPGESGAPAEDEDAAGPVSPEQPQAAGPEDDDGGGGFLDQVGGYVGGLGSAVWEDATGLVDIFTTNPVDTVRDTWNGIREDPWSLLVGQETREAWTEGDYGEALGRGTWEIGSWFIPGAGWAAKAGKLGRLGGNAPDAPSSNRNNGGNDQESSQRSEDGESHVAAACRRGSSFVPGTLVLMADGTHRPIEDIDLGEQVHAFDPLTGEEGPRAVTALPGGSGERVLAEVEVLTAQGDGAAVTATGDHPFWAPEAAEWVEAADLEPGTWLRTSAGTWVQVSAVDTWTEPHQQVHNLTVEGLHTYHVVVGDADLLVGNDSSGCPVGSRDPESQRGDVGMVADRMAAHASGRSIDGVDDLDVAAHLEDVMRSSEGIKMRDTPSGNPRWAWWDEESEMMIIREGNDGTFFQPRRGYQYFLEEVTE